MAQLAKSLGSIAPRQIKATLPVTPDHPHTLPQQNSVALRPQTPVVPRAVLSQAACRTQPVESEPTLGPRE